MEKRDIRYTMMEYIMFAFGAYKILCRETERGKALYRERNNTNFLSALAAVILLLLYYSAILFK